MSVVVITPPAELPVSVEQARRHVRADAGDDDAYLADLLSVATAIAEKWTGRAFVTQTLEMRLDEFGTDPIPLAYPPISSPITSVKYDDSAGDEQTLAAETYRLIGGADASLVLAYSASWPTAFAGSEAVRIRYVAGYGAASAVPMPIKQAILLMVGDLYDNRDKVDINKAAEILLSAYRIPHL